MEIPEHLELDVTQLAIGDSLRVADLPALEGVTFLDDPETVLASVGLPTRVEEPEEAEVEGEEGEEIEGEAAEGEAPAGETESEAEASGGEESSEG
jgi:large subunit ribosomal protein L25